MSEVSRPSKRLRLSPEGDGAANGAANGPPASSDSPPGRDEEFWLEDGNVVLIARNTAFRIYRGLLAAQSSIFADMFTAASSKADETCEGCPVVHLSESPEDLRHFLRVLLPKSHRPFGCDDPQTKVSFDQLFAVTRLSHKYQVDDILQQAIALLKAYYTTPPDCFTKTRTPCDTFTATQAIGAVNLALLTETPVIVPRALFHCASLGPLVLAGWTREDGTVEHLSSADVSRALNGRDLLVKESFFCLRRIFGDPPSKSCPEAAACRNKMLQLLVRGIDTRGAFDPEQIFKPWHKLMEDAEVLESLCTVCLKGVQKKQGAVMCEVWQKLPTFFDVKLEGWPTAKVL